MNEYLVVRGQAHPGKQQGSENAWEICTSAWGKLGSFVIKLLEKFRW